MSSYFTKSHGCGGKIGECCEKEKCDTVHVCKFLSLAKIELGVSWLCLGCVTIWWELVKKLRSLTQRLRVTEWRRGLWSVITPTLNWNREQEQSKVHNGKGGAWRILGTVCQWNSSWDHWPLNRIITNKRTYSFLESSSGQVCDGGKKISAS